MRIEYRRLFTALALVSASGATAATNLVINGDFSAPATGSGWTQRDSIPGWTSNSGDKLEVGNAGVYGATCFTQSCQLLEVNANIFGSVTQIVTGLRAGSSYGFSWANAGRDSGGAQQLNVFVDGNQVGSHFSTGFTGWLSNSVRFTATGTSAALTFASRDVGGRPSYGNLITDVSVAGVPEPATWAMLISGFGLVGYAARRRRRQAIMISG